MPMASLRLAERSEVETAIVSNPDLRSRLSVFERTKNELSGLYDEPMKRPVPDRLVDAVFGVSDGAGSRAERSRPSIGAKSAFADMLSVFLPRERMAFAIPAIVGLLVFAGGFSGWHLRSIGGAPSSSEQPPLAVLEHGKVLAQSHLRQALETTPSGGSLASPHEASGHDTVKPQLTFRTADDKICRQYLLTSSKEGHFTGVACRGAKGAWQVQVHVAAVGRSESTGKFTPAAGPAPTLIDEHVDQLIAGDALGREEELRLLNSWKNN